MKPTVIGYARVSTVKQAEEGLGLEVQERAIRAWAKANGYRLRTIHRDEGISGANGVDTRVGLFDALAEVKEGAAVGLVVYRLDRLARDLVLQEQLLAEVRRLGGDVFSTSAAEAAYLVDDPKDPSRKLIRQVLGAVSEYERAMIVMRLRAGTARKRERGGYVGGAPGYGWKADRATRELVRDEGEQRALDLIRRLRGEGRSLREIARELDMAGHKPRRAAQWSAEAIRQALRRG